MIQQEERQSDHTASLMRIVLLGASGFVLFYGLGDRLLKTWDESIYAEVAREMLRRHSWVTPSWNFQPWFEKPPLFMWLTALSYRCFGVSETTSRLLGVLCGAATVWLTFEIGRRLMSDWFAFTAALILLTNSYFILVSRFEAINAPLAFCFTLVAYGYVRALQGNPRWWYCVAAAIGAAIMLKGAAGLLAPLSVCLALILDGRFGTTRSREFRAATLLAVAIALPWHILMIMVHGRAFLNEYLGYHVLERLGGIEAAPQPAYFYLWGYWLTFSPLLVLTAIGVILHMKGQGSTSIILSFALVVTGCFSLAGTKLLAYVAPAFPFVSLLAVLAIYRLLKNTKHAILYSIACAIVLLPWYWWSKREQIYMAYDPNLAYIGSMNRRDEPLMRLLLQVRPGETDPNPPPLIICLDGFRLEKQQSVFYSGRPVIQAFVSAPPSDTESHSPQHARYEGLVPLQQVVTSRRSPIIVRNETYQGLITSGKYSFVVIAESYPLVLGEISQL